MIATPTRPGRRAAWALLSPRTTSLSLREQAPGAVRPSRAGLLSGPHRGTARSALGLATPSSLVHSACPLGRAPWPDPDTGTPGETRSPEKLRGCLCGDQCAEEAQGAGRKVGDEEVPPLMLLAFDSSPVPGEQNSPKTGMWVTVWKHHSWAPGCWVSTAVRGGE